MSPQLQNLDGTPLSWPELHRRVAEYWATHDRDGNPKPEALHLSAEGWSRARALQAVAS